MAQEVCDTTSAIKLLLECKSMYCYCFARPHAYVHQQTAMLPLLLLTMQDCTCRMSV
jgi:hypothetical protein